MAEPTLADLLAPVIMGRGLDHKSHAACVRRTAEIIAAIEAAGWAIVPVEPTDQMQEAGGNCGGFEFDGESGTIWPKPIWLAMVGARPR
jgi:hypothetical protein